MLSVRNKRRVGGMKQPKFSTMSIDFHSGKMVKRYLFIFLSLLSMTTSAVADKSAVTSELHYQGDLTGSARFEDVYCDISNQAMDKLDIRAPETPRVSHGRFDGPRLTLLAGRILWFVPDQYNQRPSNTFRYDMQEPHPGIAWKMETGGHYLVTFHQLELHSLAVSHVIRLSGELHCTADSTDSLKKMMNLLNRK